MGKGYPVGGSKEGRSGERERRKRTDKEELREKVGTAYQAHERKPKQDEADEEENKEDVGLRHQERLRL